MWQKCRPARRALLFCGDSGDSVDVERGGSAVGGPVVLRLSKLLGFSKKYTEFQLYFLSDITRVSETSISNQFENLERRIFALPRTERSALAASAANWLIQEHLSLPEERLDGFVTGWAPIVHLLWQAIIRPSTQVNEALNGKLREYYTGPYCHELGDDAIAGADEDAAAAAKYATEAYCTGNPKAAGSAAIRLLTAAEVRATEIATGHGEDWMSERAEERIVSYQQTEIDHLNKVLTALEQAGVNETTLMLLQGP